MMCCASFASSRIVTLWSGSCRPVELMKCDRVRPSSRARLFIISANCGSLPAMPSASVMQASLPDCTMTPYRRSVTFTRLLSGANIAAPPRVLADQELGVGIEAAFLDLVEHHLHGHQLGQAGRERELVGGLIEQDAAAVGVDEDRVRRRGLESLPRLLGLAGARQGGGEHRGQRRDFGKSADSPII